MNGILETGSPQEKGKTPAAAKAGLTACCQPRGRAGESEEKESSEQSVSRNNCTGKCIERVSGSVGRMSDKYLAHEEARQLITSGSTNSKKGENGSIIL